MTNTILSIIIPSYNRPRALLETLKAIAPQCVEHGIRIIVIDNSSPISAQSILLDNFSSSELQWRVIRNPHNIGGNANLCRCFENCETPWMWLLGDDDSPRENAIETILKHISSAADYCCMINFGSSISDTYSIREMNDFSDVAKNTSDPKYFSNLLFISSSVFRIPMLVEHLPHAYHFSFSCAPQLILPFLAMSHQKSSILNSAEWIVDWNPPNQDKMEHWNTNLVTLGLGTLSDHPDLRHLNNNVVRHAVKCLIGNFRYYSRQIFKNIITCPPNDLKYWSSAYLRISANLAPIDKTFFVFSSIAVNFFRLFEPIRAILNKRLNVNDNRSDNLSRS